MRGLRYHELGGFALWRAKHWGGEFMRVIDLAAAAAFVAATIAAAPAEAREVIAFRGDVAAGTVVVRTNERRLYYVLGGGRAIRYPVGVRKAGREGPGVTRTEG